MRSALVALALTACAACAVKQTALDVTFTIPPSAPREARCPELGEGSCVEYDRILHWKGSVTGSVIGKERVLCLDEACSEAKGVLRGRFAGRSKTCDDIEGEFTMEEELSGSAGQLGITEGEWKLVARAEGDKKTARGSGDVKDVVSTPEQGASGTLTGDLDCY